jgi:hypothetical protein
MTTRGPPCDHFEAEMRVARGSNPAKMVRIGRIM